MKRYLLPAILLVVLGALCAYMLLSGSRQHSAAPPVTSLSAEAEIPADSQADSTDALLWGVVRRQSTGEVLANAVVELRAGKKIAHRAIADARGNYKIACPPLQYDLWAKLHERGFSNKICPISLSGESHRQERDITLAVGPAVSGRVISWDRRPIPDLEVQLDSSQNSVVVESRRSRLDKDGRFRIIFEKVQGRSDLSASAEGYASSEFVSVELNKESDLTDLEFVISQGGRLTGIVVGENGASVSKAKVSLKSHVEKRPAIQCYADEEGQFRFGLIPEGGYAYVVDAKGYTREEQNDPIRIENGHELRLVIRLTKGWHVKGQVVGPSGEAIQGASVEVGEGKRTYSDKSKEDGTFLVEGIKPDEAADGVRGIDRVMCWAKGFGTSMQTAILSGSYLRFVLYRGGSLEIMLGLSDGEVPNDMSWSLTTTLRDSQNPQDQGANRFRDAQMAKGKIGLIADLAPGYYDVEVAAPGRETAVFQNVAIQSNATTRLQAMLTPGKSDKLALSLEIDGDIEKFRRKVKAMQNAYTPDYQDAVVRWLRKLTKDRAEHRKVVEEVFGKENE